MKKIKSSRQAHKKTFFLSLIVLFLITAVAILNINLKEDLTGVTGSSVQIDYRGVSDPVFKAEEGKIQTYVVLDQPTLQKLGLIQGGKELALEIAEDISEVANFPVDIAKLYQNEPTKSVRGGTLEKIALSSEKEAANFMADTTCLEKIGANYGHFGIELRIAIVSELKFRKCVEGEWLSAWMKHTFYHLDGEGFICSQESDPLFLVKDNGAVETDTSLC